MTVCAYKNKLVLKKIIFLLNYFEFFFIKIDSITLDPDPNSVYLDQQHWLGGFDVGTSNFDSATLEIFIRKHIS